MEPTWFGIEVVPIRVTVFPVTSALPVPELSEEQINWAMAVFVDVNWAVMIINPRWYFAMLRYIPALVTVVAAGVTVIGEIMLSGLTSCCKFCIHYAAACSS